MAACNTLGLLDVVFLPTEGTGGAQTSLTHCLTVNVVSDLREGGGGGIYCFPTIHEEDFIRVWRLALKLISCVVRYRQGDPLSPKLFTAVMEEVFKKADISEGVNVDGENLSNLRFADDVALLNETSKQLEKHMNYINSECMKVGLKIHKGKTKYMTNYADSEDILIGQQKIEKVTEFKYLGQTTHLKDTTKEEIYARIRAAWSCFGKNKEILQNKQLPISLKKQVMDQCILPTMTYGCQTWSLNKQMTNKLRTAQRAMERKMLDLKLKDKIPCVEIRKRTKIIDIIEYTLKQKWKWAGHIARLKDNRWTRRCTE